MSNNAPTSAPTDGPAARDPREQRASRSRTERRDMRTAMRRLEDALARAAPERTVAWTGSVVRELEGLRDAMREHVLVADADDSLLNEILMEEPRLEPRVRKLRQQYSELEDTADRIRRKLDEGEEVPAPVELRSEVRELLDGLRRHQSTETDLIWEAFAVDIGVLD